MMAKVSTFAMVAAACVGVSQAFVTPAVSVSGATANLRQASSLSMSAPDNSYHKKDFWIAPSILSADMAKLGQEVDNAMAAGADIVHFDVMDNHYVPNLTIGPLVCKGLRDHGVTNPIDVHLMVSPVDRIVGDFAEAGASFITFHPEASPHVDRTLQLIKSHGCKAGEMLLTSFSHVAQNIVSASCWFRSTWCLENLTFETEGREENVPRTTLAVGTGTCVFGIQYWTRLPFFSEYIYCCCGVRDECHRRFHHWLLLKWTKRIPLIRTYRLVCLRN